MRTAAAGTTSSARSRRLVAAAATPLVLALLGCRSAPCEPSIRERGLCEAVAAARVVAFGESHDDRAHHEFEADLLRTMDAQRAGTPLLLGLEMFQRPFQAPLDDYVAGRIDEREMLRRTEYFTRWRFDYTLYAPLWRFCREHGVRIVALNAESGVVRKVGREGLSALTTAERAQLAEEIDLANASHRRRILETFESGAHPLPPDRLEPMYEAMTAWDDTMAESAARALAQAGKSARMLVVAGAGHVVDRTGIPDRVTRRAPDVRVVSIVGRTLGKDGTSDDDPIKEATDQFTALFEERTDAPSPKLGVAFEDEPDPHGLRVRTVTSGGAASAAGIQAGDVVSALDDAAVRDLADVRYVVDASRTGDVVVLTVLRAGTTLRVPVTLAPPPPAPTAP